MTSGVDLLADTIKSVRAEAEAKSSAPLYRHGTVTAVDMTSRVVTVDVDGGTSTECPVVDDSYIPQVGHRVLLPMNGAEIVGARPPRGPTGPNVLSPDGGAGVEQMVDGDFELGVSEWVAAANTSVAQTTTQAYAGTHSMELKRLSSTGDAWTSADLVPSTHPHADARPGRAYVLSARFRAAATGRTCDAYAEAVNATGVVIDSVDFQITDTTVGWTQAWITYVPPAATSFVRLWMGVRGAVANEIHYVDDVSYREAVVDMGISGAKAWLFDTTNEGWGGTWTGAGSLIGPGNIITGAGATTCTSAVGLGGEAVVAGKLYSAFAYVKPEGSLGTQRTTTLSIRWYDGAGTFLSATDGTGKVALNGEYTQLIVGETAAPGGAAFAALRVTITSPGGSQQWHIDTAVLTKPPGARIRTNTNPTYIFPGRSTSIEVRSLAGGIVTTQWPYGLNGNTDSVLPVVPGDHWRMSADYINDAGNGTLRNPALLATWYDNDGQFMGITLGQTPITSNPGTGWQTHNETFEVPPGAAGLRMRLAMLSNAGEAIYLNNVITQRVALSDAKVQPRGAVHLTKAGPSDSWQAISSVGNTWVAGIWDWVAEDVREPITIEAVMNGYLSPTAGLSNIGIRVGITLDNWVTESFGQDIYTWVDFAYSVGEIVSARAVLTGIPVGPIYVWTEIYQSQVASCDLFGQISWRIIPA